MAELRLQNFVIARLSEYCDFRQRHSDYGRDPVQYLWTKLGEIEAPMCQLKQQMLDDAVRSFLKNVSTVGVSEDGLADFKHFLEGNLSPGDFVDAVFLLDIPSLLDRDRRAMISDFLSKAKAYPRLQEETKPQAQRAKAWEKLVGEIHRRLRLDELERVLAHKPLTERRLRFILRRLRFDTADYCAVFHFPIRPDDTFTPFILPRVEALIAANQRFLRRLRQN